MQGYMYLGHLLMGEPAQVKERMRVGSFVYGRCSRLSTAKLLFSLMRITKIQEALKPHANSRCTAREMKTAEGVREAHIADTLNDFSLSGDV